MSGGGALISSRGAVIYRSDSAAGSQAAQANCARRQARLVLSASLVLSGDKIGADSLFYGRRFVCRSSRPGRAEPSRLGRLAKRRGCKIITIIKVIMTMIN